MPLMLTGPPAKAHYIIVGHIAGTRLASRNTKAQKPRKRYFFAYRSAFHCVGLGKAVAIRTGFFCSGTPTLSSPAPNSMAPVYFS